MNKNTGIIIGVVVLIIIAGVAYASLSGGDNGLMNKNTGESSSMEDKDTMTKDGATMQDDGTGTMDEEEGMMKSGSYEAYAPEKLARATSGDVVLFFHASWCPSCRGLNADIEKNLEDIPPSVSILKLDYDAESDLKKKYGITYQHTLVQVNADGTMIKKWSGSPTLSSLVSEIN